MPKCCIVRYFWQEKVDCCIATWKNHLIFLTFQDNIVENTFEHRFDIYLLSDIFAEVSKYVKISHILTTFHFILAIAIV